MCIHLCLPPTIFIKRLDELAFFYFECNQKNICVLTSNTNKFQLILFYLIALVRNIWTLLLAIMSHDSNHVIDTLAN